MGYPKQGTKEQMAAALKRLRYLDLCERLENEETKWTHPLYLDLRREAAGAIRELIGAQPSTNGTTSNLEK